MLNRFINNTFENPDGKLTKTQIAFIVLHSLFEAYKAVISSFLTVFVPQACPGNTVCTLYQNVVPRDQLEQTAIALNSLMAFYFCFMFSLEAHREKIVKKYLTISKNAVTSKDSLIQMMCDMQHEPRTNILKLNNLYRISGQYLLLFFFVNVGVSWAVIYKNYLNNNTFIVFTTNALFMITKIYAVLKITSSGEYNIYSAYQNDNLVYNVDISKPDIEMVGS